MEIITMESPAFKALTRQIGEIAACVRRMERTRQEESKDEKLLTGEDVMRLLGVSRRTLQRMRDRRVISFTYSGRSCRYHPEDIRRYLEERRIDAEKGNYIPLLSRRKEGTDGNG